MSLLKPDTEFLEKQKKKGNPHLSLHNLRNVGQRGGSSATFSSKNMVWYFQTCFNYAVLIGKIKLIAEKKKLEL